MPVSLERFTDSARRQLLASLTGGRALITVKCKGSKVPQEHDVVVNGLARYGPNTEEGRSDWLVTRRYADGERYVYPIDSVLAFEARPFSITDPQHPDYVAPEMVVRPTAGKVQR